jgi:glycosyltransferase involved in cell wall biosynthesis
MHILFLTHYFPPEVNAPASRTYENAKRWVRAGHQVTVLTCAPNHPGGVLYPGYRNCWRQWETLDGIRVLRVMTYLSANKGVGNRSLNYFSYLLSAMAFCRGVKQVDLVVSTSPQFFCGLAGYFVARAHRCPWVVEIRDLWPESIKAVGAVRGGVAVSLLQRIERFLYHKPDRVVAVTNAFKRHIAAKGVRPEKIAVIPNGADLECFRPRPKRNGFRRQHHLEDKFIVSYVGTHGMAHALETVLEAARMLESHRHIHFLMVGDGAERQRLLKQKETLGLKNILMLSQQPKAAVPEIIAASDACMVLLRRTELFKTVIPSKIFEAMAMRRPVLLGVDGESRELIERSGGGLFIEPQNSGALAAEVLRLSRRPEEVDALGRRGERFVRDAFDREQLAGRYLSLLETVADQRVGPVGRMDVTSGLSIDGMPLR